MTYRPPALQPLWSFASAAALPHVAHDTSVMTMRTPPVLDWSPGPDGRPALRWNLGRAAKG
jgi:hypothetical protein